MPDEETGEGPYAKGRKCQRHRQERFMDFWENELVLLEVGMRGRSGGRLVVEGFYDKEPLYPEEA